MSNLAPLDYTVPPFPSLYVPIIGEPQSQNYLYHLTDIWRFTLFWTLILFLGTHATVAFFAVAVQCRNYKRMWAVPVVYVLVAGFEALLAGSLVGLMSVLPLVLFSTFLMFWSDLLAVWAGSMKRAISP